jgi:hypothetical protein
MCGVWIRSEEARGDSTTVDGWTGCHYFFLFTLCLPSPALPSLPSSSSSRAASFFIFTLPLLLSFLRCAVAQRTEMVLGSWFLGGVGSSCVLVTFFLVGISKTQTQHHEGWTDDSDTFRPFSTQGDQIPWQASHRIASHRIASHRIASQLPAFLLLNSDGGTLQKLLWCSVVQEMVLYREGRDFWCARVVKEEGGSNGVMIFYH